MFQPVAELARGTGEWARASDEAVRNWIGLLKGHGVNVVRFGVNVGGMRADQGGRLDPDMAARLKHFLDLIGPLGVRALPVMWWGHYRNFDFKGIAAYDALIKQQGDWFTNPEALALQRQYVREVVAPYVNDPRVFAWEVMNETYSAGGDRAAAIAWTNAIVDTIHELDRNHLTTTSAAEATPQAEIEWIVGARVDFFNWHAYPTYMDYGTYRKEGGERHDPRDGQLRGDDGAGRRRPRPGRGPGRDRQRPRARGQLSAPSSPATVSGWPSCAARPAGSPGTPSPTRGSSTSCPGSSVSSTGESGGVRPRRSALR